MPPVIEEFWASARAQRHMMGKHGVTLEEAEEAAESSPRHFRTYATGRGERRYIIPGKTAEGRRLWVVYVDEGGGRGRIITAREPSNHNERRRHERLRGD